MEKKDLILFSLLIIALLGIIGLQAYFSYQDFQIQTSNFQKVANQVFQQTIEAEKTSRKEQVIDRFKELLLDSTQTEISAKIDPKEPRTLFSLKDVQDEGGPYTTLSFWW